MKVGKYRSVHLIQERINFLTNAGDIDQALRLINNFVELIVTEPLCTAQIFGSKNLDDLCQRIGAINFSKLKAQSVKLDKSDRRTFVYIVTKLQKSGGHTRIIEDLIAARPEGQHVILSTELDGRSDIAYIETELTKNPNVNFYKSPKSSYKLRLTWLQNLLISTNPKKIYLFNQHQDSVAVAAIQPEMEFDACFYHHADHHLCLGLYLPHLEHVDPHPMGYHNCRNNLGIDNIYYPLTFEDKGIRPLNMSFLDDGVLTTCTAARSNKVEIPYFVSYLEVIPTLLKATGGRHIHIGQLTPWALFKIRRGLKKCGVQPDRFIYVPWVSSIWKSLHDYRVDLYIASFPYGGGLTLVEAMGAGIPVALHMHIYSKILSCIELAYPGAFSWRDPADLVRYCISLTVDDLLTGGRSGRTQYEKFHSGTDFRNIVDGVTNVVPKSEDVFKKFSSASDEWVFWMERQLNIKRIIARGIYRTLKKIRSSLAS